MILWKS